MKCLYCKGENIEGARFCRICGKELGGGRLSIIDSFPEYDFVPTSLPFFSSKTYNFKLFFAILGIIISIVSELLIYYWSTLGDYSPFFFHIIGGSLFIICLVVLLIPPKKKLIF